MPRTRPRLLPKLTRLLEEVGTNFRRARLRRRFSAQTVAERSGISRRTLQRAERGDPAVAIGIYARVLQALGLVDDLATLARDDELGRRLQDLQLPMRRRAPRRAKTDEEAQPKR